MKLLLISLQSNASFIGLKYIAANVLKHGNDVKILFLPGYLENELHVSVEKFISDYNPDLIGIGLMSIEYYPAKNLTKLLKNRFDIPVVWGGVHSIIKPEDCINHADYVCSGEGEQTIVSLLEHLKVNTGNKVPDIPGLWINNNGEIIESPTAQPERNLNNLPFQEYLPDYFYGLHNNRIYNFSEKQNLFRMYSLYGGTCHMLISSRGCPFKCSYCGNSSFINVYGRKVRARSVENVIGEMIEVKRNPFVLYMNFQDDCFFSHSSEWIADFCEQYKKHVRLPFIVRVIPTMIDREKLLMLRDAGLCWVVMGIQSGSDRINFDVFDRKIRFSAVQNAASIITEANAAPFYEMIVDNPYETEKDKMETIDALAILKKPYIISLAHLTFFPGTPLADRAVKDKIISPDAYLYRYLLEIDETYLNKLLGIAPFIPRFLVRYLNKSAEFIKTGHSYLLNFLFFFIKRIIEPFVFLFLTFRSLDYRIDWLVRTIHGNWKSTLDRLVSRYLGRSDLEYNQKLMQAKQNMPELFKK